MSRGGILSGGVTQRTRFFGRLQSYRDHHREVAKSSLQKLAAVPVSTAMTVLLIAIAIALPSGFYVMFKNVRLLSHNWESGTQISLYLAGGVEESRGRLLAQELETGAAIARTRYISRSEAMAELQDWTDFGELLGELDENPLPAVIVVYPVSSDILETEGLKAALQKREEVDSAQLDAKWVQRLDAMLELGERLVLALGLGLALAVVLVIVNTIRLAIDSRKEEIIVMKLVGGTDGFVRRPFLYTGFWYGLGGGVLATILLQIVLFWVTPPVARLTSLYASDIELSGLKLGMIVTILGLSTTLGLFGALVAVGRHLREIEPL